MESRIHIEICLNTYLFYIYVVLFWVNFRVVDRVGFEVAIATSNHYEKAYPERAFKPMLISVLQEENRAGNLAQPKMVICRVTSILCDYY